MARGIGGDDGPTLWMFVACILIWGKIQGWFGSLSDSVSGNLANPIQNETTAQIRAKEKAVKAVTYRSSALKGHPLSFYQQIADAQYDELLSWFNVDEDKLINMLKGLNKDELKAVYKCFGARDNKVLGVAQSTLTLMEFYSAIFEDGWAGNDLTNMRKIWAGTGLSIL